MTKYSCGHESEIILMGGSPLSIAAYLEWASTVGINGDKSQCWACWCKEINNKK
jgi:hypothetical protein